MYKTLWFTNAAHAELLRLASQAADGLETGGHLYGYTYPAKGDVVITNVYSAGPKTVRRWNGIDWDDEEILRLRKECRGDCRWDVGDFHTHPEHTPHPSAWDMQGTLGYLEADGWRLQHYPCIMVIVGVLPGSQAEEVGAWFWASKSEHIKLEIKVAAPDWNPVDENGNWIQQAGA